MAAWALNDARRRLPPSAEGRRAAARWAGGGAEERRAAAEGVGGDGGGEGEGEGRDDGERDGERRVARRAKLVDGAADRGHLFTAAAVKRRRSQPRRRRGRSRAPVHSCGREEAPFTAASTARQIAGTCSQLRP